MPSLSLAPRFASVWAAAPLLVAVTLLAPAVRAEDSTTRSTSNPRRSPAVDVVEKVKASVVNIHSERTVGDARNFDKKLDVALTQHRVNGMGTGIVIDPRGYLVTNHHVVDDVYSLRVRLHDGTTLPAKVVARDPEQDLAILKVDPPKPLPVIPLGTSSDLMLGEPVIAIGNAFGYEHTVTTGIVSALKRDVTLNKEVSYKSLIQTSAGINPGNSGGPLLNVYGELIGVNVAIRAGAQNIAFALPIDNVLKVAAEMMSTRKRSGTSHGLVIRDAVDTSSNPVKRWAEIDRVEGGSAAEQAGFKAGDVIDRLGDVPVRCALDVERGFLDQPAGARMDVVAHRSKDEFKSAIALKTATRIVPGMVVSNTGDVVWKRLGLKVEPVAADIVVRVNKDLRGGLAITEVNADSPAARAGFQRGDVLIGLHQWETITSDNITFVLNHPDLGSFFPLKYFLIHNGELKRGFIPGVD
ncbi:MAG TPA: trypsin-like peptidase domain-containing protein [Gemmataceae bacterium]|nr:trypsin-like peptidase domain-containing protein [Gemmataceae bacterium]